MMDQPPATAGGSESLVELRGVEPLRPACKAGIMPLDHSPENWLRRRESNPHPFVYETNALPHELLRRVICWKPAEELNLVPFHPALSGSV
jgi:hypothetical protein